MSISAYEQEIMDLWDQGLSMQQIDASTTHNLRTIKRVVSCLHVAGREEHKDRADTILQDRMFIKKMRDIFPERVMS